MNKETTIVILLSYTEFPENDVEYVLHVDPAQQPAQGHSRTSQFLRGQFLTPANHVCAALQRSRSFAQQFPLPLPADQTVLPGTEKVMRKRHKRRNQFLNPVPP